MTTNHLLQHVDYVRSPDLGHALHAAGLHEGLELQREAGVPKRPKRAEEAHDDPKQGEVEGDGGAILRDVHGKGVWALLLKAGNRR